VFVSLLLSTAVFAPTDEAFAKVENLDAILSDPGNVIRILTNHVVGNTFLAADLTDGLELFALGQQALKFSIVGDDIFVNGAKLVQTDIIGFNGVVHAIDTVIMLAGPPVTTPAPAVADEKLSTPTAAPSEPPSPETAGALTVSHLMALIGSLAVAAGINAL
jgi:hypothetical protein